MVGNRRLADWQARGPKRALFVLAAVVLTAAFAPASAAAWVGGSQGEIAYSSQEGAPRDAPDAFHIWTIAPDGTSKRQLTHGGQGDYEPSWSPSGSQIVFSRFESFGAGVGSRIMIMDSNGNDARPLTSPTVSSGIGETWGDSYPVFSPDGTKIAFIRVSGGSDAQNQAGLVGNVWVMNADGGDQHALTDFGPSASLGPVAWAPDGRSLLFSIDGSGLSGLYEITTAGTRIHRLGFAQDWPSSVDWSPAGILFAVNPAGPEVAATDSSPTAQPVSTDQSYVRYLSWAPDATSLHSDPQFAFTAGELFTASVSGGPSQQLTYDTHFKGQPAWGPAPPNFHYNPSAAVIERPVERGHPVIPVLINCPGSGKHNGCLVTLTLSAAGHSLRSQRLTLKPGASRTVRLRLSSKQVRSLRFGEKLLLIVHKRIHRRTTVIRQATHVLDHATLNMACPAAPVQAGSTVTLSGSLSAQSGGASHATVGLVAISPSGRVEPVASKTNGGGSYSLTFQPNEPGRWVLQTNWNGDRKHPSTPSRPCNLTVTQPAPKPTTLKLSCPGKASLGGALSVTGALSPGFTGARVQITFTPPKGSATIDTVTTNSKGGFTGGVKPNESGNWRVQARYAGDSTHSASSSPTCTVSVS